MLRELQDAVRRSLLAGDGRSTPEGLTGGRIPAADRFAIYRNNVMGSLVAVLGAAYPVVERRLGADRFRATAAAYVRAEPPRLPQLSAYGGTFPAFLAGSQAARGTPWLPDLARLEWARNEAYFAADAPPLSPAALQAVPVDRYPAIRFTLHPSVRLVRSPYPIARLWQAEDDAAEGQGAGEAVLVGRPAMAVGHRTLGPGDAALIGAVTAGAPLGAAAAAALAAEPGFDLLAALAAHLAGGTFGGFSLAEEAPGTA